jgi:hypothetical protein
VDGEEVTGAHRALAAATALALSLTLGVSAASAVSAGFNVVADPGFEKTKCLAGADECTNSAWVSDPADPADLFCLRLECPGGPASGKAWGQLGGVTVGPGGSAYGVFFQELYDPPYHRVLSFDLRRGVAVPGVTASFTVGFLTGSGGICCAYQAPAADSPEPYKRVELAADFPPGHRFSLGSSCTNNNEFAAACPTFDVDNVRVTYDGPTLQITKHPKKKTRAMQATFEYRTTKTPRRVEFECKLDNRSFAPCLSPRIYSVKKGPHSFTVRPIGEELPLPASYEWRVLKR